MIIGGDRGNMHRDRDRDDRDKDRRNSGGSGLGMNFITSYIKFSFY